MDTLIATIQAAHDHRMKNRSAADAPDQAASARGPVSRLFHKFRKLYGVEK
jgi:two-component system NtrC family response regulator